MKDLHELEQHAIEANISLSQKNWLKIVPSSQLKEAHTKMVEVRNILLNAIFHCADVIGAVQWMIDHSAEEQPGLPAKSVNSDGVQYSTEDLLKMRLNALYSTVPESIVDDVVKYVKMAQDDMRQQVARMMYDKAQLTERLMKYERQGS